MSKQRRALAAALEVLDRADMNGLPGLTPAYIAIGEALAELEQEPAQAVPVAWKHDCAALLTNNVELWIDACPHCGKPRTAPPAVDDETKRMVMELCRLTIDNGAVDGIVTAAMEEMAAKIRERLEAGQ